MAQSKHRTTYEELEGILERYVSRITMSSVLSSVLAQRSLSQHEVDGENIIELVEEVMVGLRLFCDPARLPDLMIELAELCDRETLFAFGARSQRPAALQRVGATD